MQALSDAERRSYGANIGKAYAFQALNSFALWMPIWVVYLQQTRGFSLTQIAVLDAPFWLIMVLAEVPTGTVADRWGRKTSLLLGSAFVSAAVFVFGFADNYAIILVSYLSWGIGWTLQSGADSALIFESLRADGREQEFQKVAGRFWGVRSGANLAGVLLGAPLAAATSLQTPILISAGISLLALPIGLTMREPPGDHEEERLPYGQLMREGVRLAWRTPPVRTMLVLSAVVPVASMAPSIFTQPFLVGHGVKIEHLGFVQTPGWLIVLAGSLAAYRVSELLGTRGAFIAMPLLLIGSYTVLTAWDSPFAYSAFVVAALPQGLALPLAQDYLNRRIPSSQRATILSLRQLLWSLVMAPSEAMLGVLADQASLRALFFAAAVFVAVTAPVALFFWLRSEGEDPGVAAEPAPAG